MIGVHPNKWIIALRCIASSPKRLCYPSWLSSAYIYLAFVPLLVILNYDWLTGNIGMFQFVSQMMFDDFYHIANTWKLAIKSSNCVIHIVIQHEFTHHFYGMWTRKWTVASSVKMKICTHHATCSKLRLLWPDFQQKNNIEIIVRKTTN